MGTMNDKCVDKLHKKREPKHWNAKHSTTQSVVVARRGVCHTGLESRTSARPQPTRQSAPVHPDRSATHTFEPRLAQVIARVDVKHAIDPNEPLVSGGHALLEGLTPEERRSLLDQAHAHANAHVTCTEMTGPCRRGFSSTTTGASSCGGPSCCRGCPSGRWLALVQLPRTDTWRSHGAGGPQAPASGRSRSRSRSRSRRQEGRGQEGDVGPALVRLRRGRRVRKG